MHYNGGMGIQYSSNRTVLKLITPTKIPFPERCWHSILNFKGEKIMVI